MLSVAAPSATPSLLLSTARTVVDGARSSSPRSKLSGDSRPGVGVGKFLVESLDSVDSSLIRSVGGNWDSHVDIGAGVVIWVGIHR